MLRPTWEGRWPLASEVLRDARAHCRAALLLGRVLQESCGRSAGEPPSGEHTGWQEHSTFLDTLRYDRMRRLRELVSGSQRIASVEGRWLAGESQLLDLAPEFRELATWCLRLGEHSEDAASEASQGQPGDVQELPDGVENEESTLMMTSSWYDSGGGSGGRRGKKLPPWRRTPSSASSRESARRRHKKRKVAKAKPRPDNKRKDGVAALDERGTDVVRARADAEGPSIGSHTEKGGNPEKAKLGGCTDVVATCPWL